MDPISAIIAMVASAALQSYSANQAANRQSSAAVQAQQRQLDARNQATQLASQRAEQYDPTQRQQAQDAIQQQLTQQYQTAGQPQVTAQGVQVGATIPDNAGSSDYTLAKAREQAKTTASMHALASIMGRIGAPGQLRQQEAVGIGDTAGGIGRIQSGAENIGNIDQIGIQAAGRPDFLTSIASKALGAYGTSQLMGAGLGGSTPSASGLSDAPGALGSGTWFPTYASALKGGRAGGALGSGTWLPPGAAY